MGRAVVPDVYSIMPPSAAYDSPLNSIGVVDCEPCVVFSTYALMGGFSTPSPSTSDAKLVYLAEDSSASASLWLRMYRSSEGGNEGASGTAMALEARMERKVTENVGQSLINRWYGL